MQAGYLRGGLQSALQGLSQYVSAIPTDCQRHVIVITFVLRNRQTNVQFEIQQLEGGVRATGLLCLVGVGIGLGSVVIYKLYTTLFPRKRLEGIETPKSIRPTSADLGSQSPGNWQ